MNIVIIGSGGREHALCYKLLKSSKINKIYCIPGNAGTDEIATNIFADINDFDEIYKIVLKLNLKNVDNFLMKEQNYSTREEICFIQDVFKMILLMLQRLVVEIKMD